MSRVVTTTETITPAMAESWLEKNKDNRPLRDHHVKLLAKEMRENRWELNGEAIVFDEDGNLVDGQHRLWAAFDSGVSFTSVVVRNVSKGAFATIDSGMKRSAGDALTKVGIKYGREAAAILRLVHFVTTGARDHLIVQRMSNSETLELMQQYPDIEHVAAMTACSMPLRRVMPITAMAALLYFARQHDKAKAEEFFSAVATGENLRRGDPRLTTRNYFISHPGKQRPHARIQLAMLIKAWNAWIEGRDLTYMKFIDGEEFPVMHHMQRPAARRLARRASEERVSA